jgi:hypothetical protein
MFAAFSSPACSTREYGRLAIFLSPCRRCRTSWARRRASLLAAGVADFAPGATVTATSTRTISPVTGSTALASGTVSPSRSVSLVSVLTIWRIGFSALDAAVAALGARTEPSSNFASSRQRPSLTGRRDPGTGDRSRQRRSRRPRPSLGGALRRSGSADRPARPLITPGGGKVTGRAAARLDGQDTLWPFASPPALWTPARLLG